MTDGAYREHRVLVPRHARWGQLGVLTAVTNDVWCVLHGYGHLAASFAASARWPVTPARAFVFPEALQRFYDMESGRHASHLEAPVGATWMTREAREDDIADNHAYLDVLWDVVCLAAPRASLTVLGFSQGAATAARWCAARAARGNAPARLILWGGVLPAEVSLAPDAPIRAIPVATVFGTRDRWATAERVSAEQARLAAAGFTVAVHRFDGGHRLDDATLERIASSKW